jgi:hypothetical protein
LLRGIVHDLYVGNQSFAVDMRNRWDGAALSGPVSQDVYLAIGFNTQPSDNVVIDSDGTATIASVSTVIGPKATSIDPTSRQGAAVVEFLVPNDNGIAGLELLFQWIVWDGTTWLLSDVHGSLVFPAPTQTTAMRTSNQTPSAQSRSSGESWLNGIPGAMSTAARAAFLQRVQASLRR